MITITITRSQNSLIESFTVSGHAGFADSGQDIVCAGVSAVSIGTVNAVELLTGIELQVDLREDGFLHCDVPTLADNVTMEKVQLLLEGMLVSLQTIKVEYKKYIKIKINH
jgi:uncharacterized protein YsxB (DUF464 family)